MHFSKLIWNESNDLKALTQSDLFGCLPCFPTSSPGDPRSPWWTKTSHMLCAAHSTQTNLGKQSPYLNEPNCQHLLHSLVGPIQLCLFLHPSPLQHHSQSFSFTPTVATGAQAQDCRPMSLSREPDLIYSDRCGWHVSVSISVWSLALVFSLAHKQNWCYLWHICTENTETGGWKHY